MYNLSTLARFLARWQDAAILLDKDDVQAKLARETFNEPNDYPLLFIVSKTVSAAFALPATPSAAQSLSAGL